MGKSKTLRQIAHRLEQVPDLTVGVMQRPQSAMGDFYRELGELFNVGLSVANRYRSFKALRQRWMAHCKSTLLKPVLLIDEAQHVSAECLTELHLLQSHHFDSQSLLFTIKSISVNIFLLPLQRFYLYLKRRFLFLNVQDALSGSHQKNFAERGPTSRNRYWIQGSYG